MNDYELETFLLKNLMSCYTKYDYTLIEDYISEGVTYDSIWVIEQIKGKAEFTEYMQSKLQALNNSQSKLVLKIMYDNNGRPHLVIVSPKDPKGGMCCFTIEAENNLIRAIHLTPTELYGHIM